MKKSISLYGIYLLTIALGAVFMSTTGIAQTIKLLDPLSASSGVSEYSPGNLLNNSGLSSPLGTNGTVTTADLSAMPTVDVSAISVNVSINAFRQTSATLSSPLVFTLGGSYNLSGMYYYNYEEIYQGTYYNGRGIQTVDIQYSTDNGATYTDLGNFTLNEAPQSPYDSGSLLSFGSTITNVTNIKFNSATNYGDGGYIGMNEVRFQVQPVTVWTGSGTDNNWSTAGNWDQNSVPISQSVLTFDGKTCSIISWACP